MCGTPPCLLRSLGNETHAVAERKLVQMDKLRAAFGLEESAKEGEAFDRDLQEQRRLERIAEREQREKEREKEKRDAEKRRRQREKERKKEERKRKREVKRRVKDEKKERRRLERERKVGLAGVRVGRTACAPSVRLAPSWGSGRCRPPRLLLLRPCLLAGRPRLCLTGVAGRPPAALPRHRPHMCMCFSQLCFACC